MTQPIQRVRIHKFIAGCGTISRRRAEDLIREGRVELNGEVVRVLGTTVDPEHDRVAVDGRELHPPRRVTLALHKPRGVITTTRDTHGRRTVLDLLPPRLRELGVVPVGRLDLDSEGLLVMTNDGELNRRITHPSTETDKEYEALVHGRIAPSDLERLRDGVQIDGRMTAPARVVFAKAEGTNTRVRLVVHEGRKRQVRRMFFAVGHEVIRLTRVRVGGLVIGDLAPGQWRELGEEDIRRLLGD